MASQWILLIESSPRALFPMLAMSSRAAPGKLASGEQKTEPGTARLAPEHG